MTSIIKNTTFIHSNSVIIVNSISKLEQKLILALYFLILHMVLYTQLLKLHVTLEQLSLLPYFFISFEKGIFSFNSPFFVVLNKTPIYSFDS